GNVTVVTETSDGRRQVLNSRLSDAPHNDPNSMYEQRSRGNRHSSNGHHNHGFFPRRR
ncbi:17387_t:CDS:2, partial [Funneliformis caledonium]